MLRASAASSRSSARAASVSSSSVTTPPDASPAGRSLAITHCCHNARSCAASSRGSLISPSPHYHYSATIFETIPTARSFRRRPHPEMRTQLQHRLVMHAAHRLRVDPETGGDLGDVHVLVVE